jgi:hypothetical protein
MAMQGLQHASSDVLATAKEALELANRAYFLYVTESPAEPGRLLKKVLLNCRVDGTILYPTYRKPFDMICERAKNQEWSGQQDSNLRPEVPKTSALPDCAIPRMETDAPALLPCSRYHAAAPRTRAATHA